MVQLSDFHFLMSQNRIQTVSLKKTPLNYPNSICEILTMCGKKTSHTSIHEKNQTNWTIHEKTHLKLSYFLWILLACPSGPTIQTVSVKLWLLACPSGLYLWSKKHKFYFININHYDRLYMSQNSIQEIFSMSQNN